MSSTARLSFSKVWPILVNSLIKGSVLSRKDLMSDRTWDVRVLIISSKRGRTSLREISFFSAEGVGSSDFFFPHPNTI